MSKNVALQLRFNSESQCSKVCSSNGRLTAIPALLTRMSIFPYSATAASMSFWGPVVADKSASTAMLGVVKLLASFWARSETFGKG